MQAFFVGVAVLNDDRRDAIRVLERKAISDGRAVIHDVHRIALHRQLLEQIIHEVGVTAEAIVKRRVLTGDALEIITSKN